MAGTPEQTGRTCGTSSGTGARPRAALLRAVVTGSLRRRSEQQPSDSGCQKRPLARVTWRLRAGEANVPTWMPGIPGAPPGSSTHSARYTAAGAGNRESSSALVVSCYAAAPMRQRGGADEVPTGRERDAANGLGVLASALDMAGRRGALYMHRSAQAARAAFTALSLWQHRCHSVSLRLLLARLARLA
jgi:hypothetical protein